MRHLVATVLALLLIIAMTPVYAEKLTVMDEYSLLTEDEIKDGVMLDPETLFAYTILDDQTVKIERYTWICSDVSIPEEIQGRKVTWLGDYLFLYSPTVNVFLPHTDIHISDAAFDYFEGVVWLPGDHPTLDFAKAIIRKDTHSIEYYCRYDSTFEIDFRRYCEIEDY